VEKKEWSMKKISPIFRKTQNEHPQKDLNLGDQDGWEQKELFGWYRPYDSEIKGQRPDSMKILFNTRKKETDQDQNEENAPENGDRPSKNSTTEQKRERQGSQRTKAQPSDPTQSPQDI
jgi:hypothetical protein